MLTGGAIAACALGMMLTPAARAAWPGANGKIAFIKFDFSNFSAQIYSMNSQGQDQQNLSAAGGGAGQTDIQPNVSPNGKRIAFARFDPTSGSAQLWVMSFDGSRQTDISNDAALASESGPAWSEDGSKILFVKQPAGSFPGDQGAGPASAGGSIWIRKANARGTPRQLTAGSNDANPAMSPDGERIAFSRPLGGARHLFVMKADGTGTPTDLGQGSKPDWSPDNTHLVYGQGGAGPIMVVNVSNPSDKQTLTTLGNEAPAWSPDGSQIAFQDCTSMGPCQIAVMSATGQNQHDITSDPTLSAQKPSWQPRRHERDDQNEGDGHDGGRGHR
jgi:Tol biopolymer transport system component